MLSFTHASNQSTNCLKYKTFATNFLSMYLVSPMISFFSMNRNIFEIHKMEREEYLKEVKCLITTLVGNFFYSIVGYIFNSNV